MTLNNRPEQPWQKAWRPVYPNVFKECYFGQVTHVLKRPMWDSDLMALLMFSQITHNTSTFVIEVTQQIVGAAMFFIENSYLEHTTSS